MVDLQVGSLSIGALVDTGASCTLLRLDIFHTLADRAHRHRLLADAPALRGVSGASLDVRGSTEIKIQGVAKPIRVTVLGDLPCKMVLGEDALQDGQGIIDFGRNVLRWHRREWPMRRIEHAFEASLGQVLPETGDKHNKLIQKNADLFSAKGEPNGFCSNSPIHIKTNHPPISQAAYRTPLSKRKLVEEAIADMLNENVIRPSESAWASPITLVPKRDGSTRFCVDYRKLNSVTIRDQYPLPQIQDIFDQVGGSTIFSSLDLKAGYWQLAVAEDSIEKTAFRCHLGHYEFLRMPFGLTNAPAVFQRMMDKVLAGLIGRIVMVYLDDIVIYSRSEEEHVQHLELVFARLREAGLRLKPTKCFFGLEEIKLLGYIVNRDGIHTDPEKVKAIAKLTPPRDLKGVRSFLGMTGFYRQCLPDYAQIAEPLEELKRKYAHFVWGPSQSEAFEKLKQLLTSSHVMTAPRTDRPYKLYTDACDYAVGAILVQVDDSGTERVIQYVSHSLSSVQRRWATIEKEAYAVVYAISKLRPYLYGADFTVYTDHKPLTSLFTKEMQNTKIQRWAVLLSEYGATIQYRKGKNNIRADMLSRIPPETGIHTIDCDDWVDPTAIPEQDTSDVLPLLYDGLDLEEVSKAQHKEFPDILQSLTEDSDDYTLIKGRLFSIALPSPNSACYPRLVLPATYRERVIKRAHKEVGHMATGKTFARLREAYVWPGMRREINELLKLCPVCRVHQRRTDHVPMGEMPLAAYPMQIVGADLIGPFVPSHNGNRYVLTLIDHCTGWAEAFPLKDKTNASVWQAWATHVVPRHGAPEVLITDNGQEFKATAWRTYLKQLGVEHRTTTPVHPQSNGRTERFNRTLKELLAKSVNNYTPDWEDRLGDCLAAYRVSVSDVTGHTPFFLLYGRRVRTPLTRLLQPRTANHFGNRLDDLSSALQTARHATADSRKYNRQRLANRADAKDIHVGDTVLLKAEERLTLTSRWDPQWEVVRVRGPVLWLRQQQSGKLRVANREKVKLVEPHLNWDEITPRPRRTQRRPRAVIGGAPIIRPPQTPPNGLARAGQEECEPSQTPPTVEPSQGDSHAPPAADIDIPLSPGSPTPSTHSGHSVGSGPSSVIMDSPPQDNPSPCRLTLTRREEGWAVKQPTNFPPPNLPDNVPPLKLCRRNRRWAIDGRASTKRPAPDVPHRRQRGRYMLRRTPKRRLPFCSPPSPDHQKRAKCELLTSVCAFAG